MSGICCSIKGAKGIRASSARSADEVLTDAAPVNNLSTSRPRGSTARPITSMTRYPISARSICVHSRRAAAVTSGPAIRAAGVAVMVA